MKIIHGIAKDGVFIPSNKKESEEYFLSENNRKLYGIFKREIGTRTLSQNSSLHVYFDLLAKELNDAGYTVQIVMKQKVDLDWDKEKVKELLWRPAQKAILRKHSTTALGKFSEIDLVYEHLNRHIGEKFGIHIPWPVKPDQPDPIHFHEGLEKPEGPPKL